MTELTQVLIVRHGNTFTSQEPPRRVGARTDLALVEEDKASAIGKYLLKHFKPDQVFCSPLLRTRQTAAIALKTAGFSHIPQVIDDRFIEIDYGPDENQVEQTVIDRIGLEALEAWNQHAIVPTGWNVDVKALQKSWHDFFNTVATKYYGQRILVVTSNGVARFAPDVLQQNSPEIKSLKIKTGNMSLFQADQNLHWHCVFWDQNPQGFKS